MPVLVTRAAPKSPTLSKALVRRQAEAMLQHLKLEGCELSILLCDDQTIRRINRQHRHLDKPTDVLSFPQHEFTAPERPAAEWPLEILGDVIVSLDTAARQASSRKRLLADEVRFLLAHGILHLLGYDHGTAGDKRLMSARTRQLVSAARRESARSLGP